MASVRINGEESSIAPESVARVAELIELVKAHIDPDHMITEISLNGQELSESDWQATTVKLGSAVIEVSTGSPKEYVRERFSHSSDIVEACLTDFVSAKNFFRQGLTVDGNKRLRVAVETLRTFFEWFGTLQELLTDDEKARVNISSYVNEISDTCKKICQHQLYQSWWALSQSIENELEPRLTNLKEFFGKTTSVN